mgnify:FL=1|tara:strand:+ start:390 stop:839 length:450 start_codon:yes stop_codon:yes gene_type:complete
MIGYFQVSVLCLTALGWMDAPNRTADRYKTCIAVGVEAEMHDLPASLVVALSYTESRFSPGAVSDAGASGPLQVVPRFHCPDGKAKGCDLITAGLRALKKYRKKYKRWPAALCHWNSGNRCYRKSKLFARIVLKRRLILTRALGDDDGH